MFAKSRWVPLLLGTLLLMRTAEVEAAELHLGVVVSTMAGTLVVADEDGKQQKTFEVPATATITLNAMPAKLEDLTQGDQVTVTSEIKDGKAMVTKVDAKSAKVKGGEKQ